MVINIIKFIPDCETEVHEGVIPEGLLIAIETLNVGLRMGLIEFPDELLVLIARLLYGIEEDSAEFLHIMLGEGLLRIPLE